jgi:hypothetical protein
VFATGARRFDAYTFATCPGSAPACITVTLTNACTAGVAQVFPMVYLGSFDPNNVAVNYLADMGFSPTGGQPGSFSFLVPGGSSFVVVVHEVNPGAAVGCNYTLTVSGLCQSCAGSSLVCLQDDRTGDHLLFNTATGDYLYTRCTDNVRMSGRGTVRREGCKVELLDGFRVEATFDRCAIAPQNKGQARIQLNPVGATCFINDSNTVNNRCLCP